MVLIAGLSLTLCVYQWAVAHRAAGEWLPGIAQLIVGWAATAVGCIGCGLTALLRRERRSWLALPPFLGGLGTMGYFAFNFFSHR